MSPVLDRLEISDTVCVCAELVWQHWHRTREVWRFALCGNAVVKRHQQRVGKVVACYPPSRFAHAYWEYGNGHCGITVPLTHSYTQLDIWIWRHCKRVECVIRQLNNECGGLQWTNEAYYDGTVYVSENPHGSCSSARVRSIRPPRETRSILEPSMMNGSRHYALCFVPSIGNC